MERELAFLKRHGFLIAGVGLPLLLVAAVLVARAVPRVLVDDPLHELVYATASGASRTLGSRAGA